MRRLLFDGYGVVITVKFDDAVLRGIRDAIREHRCTVGARCRFLQHCCEIMSVKKIVAQRQAAWCAAEKVLADEECFG